MLFIFIKPGTMREAGGCKEKKIIHLPQLMLWVWDFKDRGGLWTYFKSCFSCHLLEFL